MPSECLDRISPIPTGAGSTSDGTDRESRMVCQVSCDYLLVDNAPRRPFTSPEDALSRHQG